MKKSAILTLIPLLLVGCNSNQEATFTIFTIQPLYSDLIYREDNYMSLPAGVSNQAEIIVDGCKKLKDAVSNVVFDENNKFCDQPFTKQILQSFKKNSIIVFQNHGFYDDSKHSLIASGAYYPWGEETAEYLEEVNEGRIVDFLGCTTGECYTSKWIDAYCPDITGSIVYLDCCYSTTDSTLANAFINKGAKAVYGNSTYVMMRYGDLMCHEIIQSLGQINPETHKYYTTGEALEKAKNKYAANQRMIYDYDPVEECEVQLIGSSNYRIK